jgi:hypothetical protein
MPEGLSQFRIDPLFSKICPELREPGSPRQVLRVLSDRNLARIRSPNPASL